MLPFLYRSVSSPEDRDPPKRLHDVFWMVMGYLKYVVALVEELLDLSESDIKVSGYVYVRETCPLGKKPPTHTF